jgi:hypothetical protein
MKKLLLAACLVIMSDGFGLAQSTQWSAWLGQRSGGKQRADQAASGVAK